MYDTAVFDFDGVLFDGRNIYPHVKCMLSYLKSKNVKLFIASYNPFAGLILRYHGLDIYFDDIYAYFDSNHKVSHLNFIMKLYGIDKSRIVFFDDTLINVQSVAKMGITSYLVEDGYIQWCSFFK
jgi:magnesium-dependent phosphatase 1